MKNLLAVVAVLLAATAVRAQDHADCPMAHSKSKGAGVDPRHDEVTGVHHEHAVHHFFFAPSGGTIRLEATDAGQEDARDRIREHLRVIARSFATGDFALPMLIHDQVPPGVEVMKKMKAAIHYDFAPTDKGGEVRISTQDPAADLQLACDRLRSVLGRWDTLLDQTPTGKRAALLDALNGLVEAGGPSPIVPQGLRQKRVRQMLDDI